MQRTWARHIRKRHRDKEFTRKETEHAKYKIKRDTGHDQDTNLEETEQDIRCKFKEHVQDGRKKEYEQDTRSICTEHQKCKEIT